jgi:hypothetical protein
MRNNQNIEERFLPKQISALNDSLTIVASPTSGIKTEKTLLLCSESSKNRWKSDRASREVYQQFI